MKLLKLDRELTEFVNSSFAGQCDDNCSLLVTENFQQETEKKIFDHLLCTQGKR